jgi:glycosyltransferase involved in cell wall biosynthesis
MRVAYLLPDFHLTGGSMVLYEFMNRLVANRHEVIAVTPFGRVTWSPSIPRLLVAGRRVHPENPITHYLVSKGKANLHKRPRVSDILVPPYVLWMARRLRANWLESDVTISTQWTTAYGGFLLMDETTPLYHMQHYEELLWDGPMGRKMARLTYGMPFHLLANSTWLKRQIWQRFGRAACLLHPGIDSKLFYPREDSRARSGSVRKPRRIVSYYSPHKFKAWGEAVQAMRKVFSQMKDGELEWVVFGGTPKPAPGVEVRAVGPVFGEELAALYSQADIVFMNSWFESFPLPPLEGMACGAAVVTTPVGTEDYARHLVNSIVIPPRRPDLLADAILSLLRDPGLVGRLAEAGVETAQQFTWEKATEQLERILNQRFRRSESKASNSSHLLPDLKR